MRSTQVLRQEHDAVLVVLDQLERAVAAARRGVAVPADIFTDIQEFFTVFVDRCHHGKEEIAVFEQIKDDPAGLRIARRLEIEHAVGRRLAEAYAAGVAEYVPGDAASATALAEAAGAYDVMMREHIAEETDELFPAMERLLGADDNRLVDEFDRREVEEIGEGTHERLHGMIDTLPERIAAWTSAGEATRA